MRLIRHISSSIYKTFDEQADIVIGFSGLRTITEKDAVRYEVNPISKNRSQGGLGKPSTVIGH